MKFLIIVALSVAAVCADDAKKTEKRGLSGLGYGGLGYGGLGYGGYGGGYGGYGGYGSYGGYVYMTHDYRDKSPTTTSCDTTTGPTEPE